MNRELGEVWAYRALREREATLRFARLSQALATIGAGPAWEQLALEASGDEARHERLCTVFAARHGVMVGPGTGPHTSPAPRHLPPRDALLYEVVATCCVAETLNAALLTAEVAASNDADLTTLTTELLRDEVRHARLGWSYLRHAAEHGSVGVLAPFIDTMVFGAVGEETSSAPQWLPATQSQTVAYETVHAVVLPGLAEFGLRPKRPLRTA